MTFCLLILFVTPLYRVATLYFQLVKDLLYCKCCNFFLTILHDQFCNYIKPHYKQSSILTEPINIHAGRLMLTRKPSKFPTSIAIEISHHPSPNCPSKSEFRFPWFTTWRLPNRQRCMISELTGLTFRVAGHCLCPTLARSGPFRLEVAPGINIKHMFALNDSTKSPSAWGTPCSDHRRRCFTTMSIDQLGALRLAWT